MRQDILNELAQLLGADSDAIQAVLNKDRATPCPAPKKPGHVTIKGSYWYVFRYHIWPRLFSNNMAKLESANQYLENQRIAHIRVGNWPPKPLYQKK